MLLVTKDFLTAAMMIREMSRSLHEANHLELRGHCAAPAEDGDIAGVLNSITSAGACPGRSTVCVATSFQDAPSCRLTCLIVALGKQA